MRYWKLALVVMMLSAGFTGCKTRDTPAAGQHETAASQPAGTPVPGEQWIVPDLGMVLVPIRPGTFIMGSPPDEKGRSKYDTESQHKVTLTRPFWMGKYEVTQREYEIVAGSNPAHDKGPNKPVYLLTWYDAVSFCKKLTERERAGGRLPEGYVYRLPTEAEWEYCCRAGTQTAYCFGSDQARLGDYARYDCKSRAERSRVQEVGQKKPNAWGLHDMHGNVSEWCLDRGGAYPSEAVVDPSGPDFGKMRVFRGGGTWDDASTCRSASRRGCFPMRRMSCISFWGFRVVLGPGVPARVYAAAKETTASAPGTPGK